MAFVAQVYNAAPVPFFYFKLTRQYNMFTAWKKTITTMVITGIAAGVVVRI